MPDQQPGRCSRRVSRNAGKVLEKVNRECAKPALLVKGRDGMESSLPKVLFICGDEPGIPMVLIP